MQVTQIGMIRIALRCGAGTGGVQKQQVDRTCGTKGWRPWCICLSVCRKDCYLGGVVCRVGGLLEESIGVTRIRHWGWQ